jgi:hypothetical protein
MEENIIIVKNLTKKFGIISDGCIGVWGEGDTEKDAINNAGENQMTYARCDKPDFSDCEIVTIE